MSKISSIAVNINQMCDLNCIYCYRHVQAAETAEMTDEIIQKTIELIQELQPNQISFAQQEPTLSFVKLKYIVETLGDDYKYHITTNGYALTQEMINFFKLHNFGVLISYDSVVHSTSRPTENGNNSEPKVRTSCKALLNAGMNPTCLLLITEQSLPYTEEMLKDVIDLGFKSIFLNRDSQINSPTCVRSIDLFEEKMRAARLIAKEHGLDIGPFARLTKGNQFKEPIGYFCGAGKGGIAIHPDGMIYPCHHTNAWKELDKDIGSVFTGVDWDKKNNFLKIQLNNKQYMKCQECVSSLCGMCYLDNNENTGDLFTPAKISCELIQALYRATFDQFPITVGKSKPIVWKK